MKNLILGLAALCLLVIATGTAFASVEPVVFSSDASYENSNGVDSIIPVIPPKPHSIIPVIPPKPHSIIPVIPPKPHSIIPVIPPKPPQK